MKIDQRTIHVKLDKDLFFNVNKNSGRWSFSNTAKDINLDKSILRLDEWDEKIKTLVVNLTDKCNLNCVYCSRQFARKKPISMSTDLVIKVLKNAGEYADKNKIRMTVQFHGGEPLLEFNKIISAIDATPKDKLKNLKLRIQTNGTLITEEIIKECAKRNVEVGISLDGRQIENDSTRRDTCGVGTFKEIVNALNLIKKHQKEVSCLTVVTNINVKNLSKILKFFNKLGINDIGFLPLYEEPRTRTIRKEMVPDMKSLANSQKKLFEEWIKLLKKKKYKNLNISTFQILIWNLLSSNGSNKKFRVNCGVGVNSLFVESDGGVWGCGAFSYANELELGNFNHDSLEEIQNNINYRKFQQRTTSNTHECQDCPFQFICKGGCVANGYRQKGNIFDLDIWCNYWKEIIKFILIQIHKDPEIIALIPNYNIKTNE
jgi:uncharacterized protein